MRVMKRAFLLPFLLLAGCSSQAPAPSTSAQNPPPIQSGQFESTASINAEIYKRYPSSANYAQMTQVVLEILDGAQSEKTVMAVKAWASDSVAMGNALKPTRSEQDKAVDNAAKWIAAAADTKRSVALLSQSSPEYDTDKKNALSEAARADSLPFN